MLLWIAFAHADWDPGPVCSAEDYQSNGPFSVCTSCVAEACSSLAPGYVYECTNFTGDTGDSGREEEFQVWCVLARNDTGGNHETGNPNHGSPASGETCWGCGGDGTNTLNAALALGLSAAGAGALRRRR